MTSPPDNRSQFVERALSEILAWVEREEAVRGLALVGSYARGAAHQDSDVDVLILVEDPESFVSQRWLDEIDWRRLGASPSAPHVAQYGIVWSSHVQLDNGVEVEFGFAPLSWAGARPLESGTRQVISDGCRILYDPDSLLGAACAEMSKGS
jgi:nucleotidyltransferase-like protein